MALFTVGIGTFTLLGQNGDDDDEKVSTTNAAIEDYLRNEVRTQREIFNSNLKNFVKVGDI